MKYIYEYIFKYAYPYTYKYNAVKYMCIYMYVCTNKRVYVHIYV